jgi:copper chaperone CopZ
MTKVTLHYDLSRTLTDEDCGMIAALHGTYGIARVQIAPALNKITVDYDASRLMRKDVEAELARHGVPIRTAAAA